MIGIVGLLMITGGFACHASIGIKPIQLSEKLVQQEKLYQEIIQASSEGKISTTLISTDIVSSNHTSNDTLIVFYPLTHVMTSVEYFEDPSRRLFVLIGLLQKMARNHENTEIYQENHHLALLLLDTLENLELNTENLMAKVNKNVQSAPDKTIIAYPFLTYVAKAKSDCLNFKLKLRGITI
jgi:hypothetical protein